MKRGLVLILAFWGLFYLNTLAFTNDEINTIVTNIKKGDKQTVLVGQIESLVIKRGPAEFRLGPGEVTLFDFGSGRPAAMAFKGEGAFAYTPPDEVERYQLHKFTGKDTLSGVFDKATFFFSVELEGLPDSGNFTRGEVTNDDLVLLQSAGNDAIDYLSVYIPSKLIGDLIAAGPGTFFYADFILSGGDSLAYVEDPFEDDLYRLVRKYKVEDRFKKTHKTAEVINACSPDNSLVSQRGVLPIDISHYDIICDISPKGEMTATCNISYMPTRWGRQFIYFNWYPGNKMLSVCDPRGDTLLWTAWKSEPGFGVILNRPMELGRLDTIVVKYDCEALEKYGNGHFLVVGGANWHPTINISDKATFRLEISNYWDTEIVAVGKNVRSSSRMEKNTSIWVSDQPLAVASFGYGSYLKKEFAEPDIPKVRVFMSDKGDDFRTFTYAFFGGLHPDSMLDKTGQFITNNLIYFTSLFGPISFESINVIEHPMPFYNQGPPGTIFLSPLAFSGLIEKNSNYKLQAHEVSHQWWGHTINNESYRDTWIIEGLAEYSGFCALQATTKNAKICDDILEGWRGHIIKGDKDESQGTTTGPVVMGTRLISSKSDDYHNIVYNKGAYIFHMIRYLFHDPATGSEEAFADFLKEMLKRFKNKPVTTERLKELLEGKLNYNMDWFFKQWVYGTEIPQYKFDYKTKKKGDKAYLVTCRIKQKNVADDFKMLVPLTIYFSGDKYIEMTILVDKPDMEIELPIFPKFPRKIIFNAYDAVLAEMK